MIILTREQLIEEFKNELERRCVDPSVYYSGNISWCKQFVIDLVTKFERYGTPMEENMKLLGVTYGKLMQMIDEKNPGTTLTELAFVEATASKKIVQVLITVTDSRDEFLEDFETKIVTNF